MVKQASLAAELESLLGRDAVLPDPSTFAVDGIAPRATVAPASAEEVAAAMRFAHERGLAVIPWGGGTLMGIGNVPSRYDIALSLSRLDRLVEHEPADLTATVQAGIRLSDFQRRLSGAGQFLPLNPPGEDATLGGILAANASGPWRHAHGSARDWTIGMRVVTADGRVTRAGGRVVKNVAGYDLCKLYIGSLGTLGVIVEATFKLAPLPKAERTAATSFATPAAGCAFAAELHRRGLSILSAQLLNPAAASAAGLPEGHGYLLVIDLAGSVEAVERSHREMSELAGETEAQLLDAGSAAEPLTLASALGPFEAEALLCRAAVLPTRVPDLIAACESLPGSPRVVAQPTVGVVHTSWASVDDAEEAVSSLRTATARLGGSLAVEACPPALKQRIDVFPEVSGPAFELMRRVKQQFDPKGVLSPGRHVGKL